MAKKFYAVKIGHNPGVYYSVESARNQIRGYRNADWKGFNNYDTALAYVSGKQVQSQADGLAKKAAEEKARKEAEEKARKEAEIRAKQAADAKATREADDKARKAALNGHGNATANGVGELQRLKTKLDVLAQELADAETEVTDKLIAYEWAKGDRDRMKFELERLKADIKSKEAGPPKPVEVNTGETVVKLREQDLPRPVVTKQTRDVHGETWFVVRDVAYEDRTTAKKNSYGGRVYICHSRFEVYQRCMNMRFPDHSYVLRPKPNVLGREQLSYLNDEGTRIYQVFTDGACAANGTSHAAGGIGVYFGKDNLNNVSKPLEGDLQTNQRAELAAVKAAYEIIDRMNNCLPYEINTDSTYVINCLTKWCFNWQRNGWKNEGGFDVKNQDLLKDILELQLRFPCRFVTFKKVKAHSHIEGNEEADRLAQDGILKGTVSGFYYI